MCVQRRTARIDRGWFAPLLIGLFVAAAAAGCHEEQAAYSAADRAVEYLLVHQDADGAWRSPAHGIVRGGAAWTPYIVTVLQDVRFRDDHGDKHAAVALAIDKGLEFIRRSVDEGGAVGRRDALVLEYPNYATAYALMALQRSGEPGDAELIHSMRTYLLGQQWTTNRDVSVADAAYGSWGFGEVSLPSGAVGHVDVSHTRRVLEALAPVDSSVAAAALRFLALAQKSPDDPRIVLDEPQSMAPFDGGFYASPVVWGTNKAGIATTSGGHRYFRSYATATCDGLLALAAVGVTDDDQRIQSALGWLGENDTIDRVAGIPAAERGQWEDVMFYYHLNVRSRVLSRWRPTDDALTAIEALLVANQREDGAFANPEGAANKEDDPLLATAFAVSAFSHIREASERNTDR